MKYFWRVILTVYLFIFMMTVVSIFADALTSGSMFDYFPRLLLLMWEVFATSVIVVALYKLSFDLAFNGRSLWFMLFINVLLNRVVLLVTGNMVDFSYFSGAEFESSAIIYVLVFACLEIAAISSPLMGYFTQKGQGS